MRLTRLPLPALLIAFSSPTLAVGTDQVLQLDSALISAPRLDESLKDSTATVQIISREQIERSPARSLTDLLASHAVGFLSEWAPGQTSLNIRGGATDGQGRDFRSQVTVLLNGRRAGTANLSKLSPSQVARIEVIRGPASVIYGSQAIGGVVNIITRSGQNSEGNALSLQTGAWGLGQGSLYGSGRSDSHSYYLGVDAGRRGDYASADGTQHNTAWKRHGGLLSLSFGQPDEQRVELSLRSDGIYDAGFRGSQWDYNNYDNRYNQSLDIHWSARPRDWLNWSAQAYALRDVDDLHWGSERQSNGNPGFAKDHIERTLDAYGLKLIPQLLLGSQTDLLLGLDLEKSRLRNDRWRIAMNGSTSSQVAPYDINSDDLNAALYAELIQRAFDDRLTLRGGARYSYGRFRTVSTQHMPLLDSRSRSFDEVTYSLGAAYQLTPQWKVRAGVATGFRAPLAGELAADFTTTSGTQTLGNANLKAETSEQFELGLTLSQQAQFLDLALFQNRIENRISSQPLSGSTSQYVNGRGDALIRGLELQWQLDLAEQLALGDERLLRLRAGGLWNFHMNDRGAAASLVGNHRDQVQRMYRSQASLGLDFGRQQHWQLGLNAILRGPMFYNTEEKLLIPSGEPHANYVHRKDSFWVFNLRGDYQLSRELALFSGINNLFDSDRSSMYIATGNHASSADPNASNGGLGNSNPGREWYLGARYSF